MGDYLESLKVVWFVGGIIGAVFAAVSIWQSSRGLRSVLISRYPARRLAAWQSFRDECLFAAVQGCIASIRWGAIRHISPPSIEFRQFWAHDGTLVMFVGLAVTIRTGWVLLKH